MLILCTLWLRHIDAVFVTIYNLKISFIYLFIYVYSTYFVLSRLVLASFLCRSDQALSDCDGMMIHPVVLSLVGCAHNVGFYRLLPAVARMLRGH